MGARDASRATARVIWIASLVSAVGASATAPVYALVLLSRGVAPIDLSLCTAVQMVAVVALEIPSGVLADLVGRRRLFVVASVCMVIAYALLALDAGLALTVLSCALRGVGQAASSGTLDAALVGLGKREGGEAGAERAVAAVQMAESVGAVVSAALATVAVALDGSFTVLLWTAVALELFAAVLARLSLDEGTGLRLDGDRLVRYATEVGGLLKLRELRRVLAMFALVGIVLSAVETYWQPAYVSIVGEEGTWSVGVISVVAYAAVNLGILSSRSMGVTGSRRRWGVLLAARVGMLAFVPLMAGSGEMIPFVIGYAAIYLCLGVGNVQDGSLLHLLVPDGQRSGAASATSMAVRLGGFVFSIFAALVARPFGVGSVWVVALVLSSLILIAVTCSLARSSGQKDRPFTQNP